MQYCTIFAVQMALLFRRFEFPANISKHSKSNLTLQRRAQIQTLQDRKEIKVKNGEKR